MPEFNKYDAPEGDIAVPTIKNSLACTGCKYKYEHDLDECEKSRNCMGFNRMDQTNVIFLTEVTSNIEIAIIQIAPISLSATNK